MLKCVLLAKGFGLSDPQLEERLQDRPSFRRFVGLALDDATPDETTFVRFCARLREANLDRVLFDRTTAELDRRGLLVKDGSLIDATIIEPSRGRTRADGASTRDDGASTRDDGASTRDPEASFTAKAGVPRHGYKGHINADRGAIVVDYRFSDAAPHDSSFIDERTEGETRMVVADNACRSAQREAALDARGVACVIAFKRQRGQADPPPPLRRLNRLIAAVRAAVEHPFAWMKNMGYRRARCRGRRRNEVDFVLNLIAYNWKRSLSLAAAKTR